MIDSVTTHTITASYSGDTNFTDSSNSMLQTVNQAATSVTIIGATPPSVVDGNTVTFTASISFTAGNGDLTGTVTFLDGSTSLGTASFSGPSGNTTTFATSSIEPAGQTHSITAVYVPDDGTNISGNTSGVFTQTVQQTTSTTVTSASDVPSIFGNTVTFTATVNVTSSGTLWVPTGMVTFLDGGASLATASLNESGTATYTTTGLGVATHTITAAYAGDEFDDADTLALRTALLQTVGQASTTTTVTSSTSGTSAFGQSVTFTATVTPQFEGTFDNFGTVTFSDGATSLGTASLSSSGQATYSAPSSVIDSVTTHTITASYSGDTNFTDSSNSMLQTVNQASTSLTITGSTPSAVVDGDLVTFTASVSFTAGSGSLAGMVTFFDDGSTSLGTASFSGGLSGSTTTFTTSSIEPAGQTHSISAVYVSDDSTNIVGSQSDAFTQTVQQKTSTTVTSTSSDPSKLGDPVTLTATVNVTSLQHGSWVPSGTVTFLDGDTSLATASLIGTTATATYSTSSLGIATHTITAAYAGDEFDATDTLAQRTALLQTVGQTNTTISVTSSTSASVFGQSVTFTATVSATNFDNGGTVTFSDGGTSIGTASLSGGKATFSTTGLSAVTHTINAVYGGDTNFYGSLPDSMLQTVNKAGTSTTGTTPLTQISTYGQLVTFTAIVSVTAPGGGTPTGTVTFYTDNANHLLGTGTLASLDGVATATFTTSSLAVAYHQYNGAVYGGDSNFNGSGQTNDGMPNYDVHQASSTTYLTSLTSASVFGQPVTFTAVVSPDFGGTATGTVTFSDGSTSLGTVSVSATTSPPSPPHRP